jgi:hypothetical protein
MTTYEPGTVASATGQVYEARRYHEGRVEINLAEWTPVGDWIEYAMTHLFEPGPEPYGMCSHPDPHTIEQAHECDALAREEREDVSGAREAS